MGGLVQRVEDYAGWRHVARQQLSLRTPPSSLIWQDAADEQQFLFSGEQFPDTTPNSTTTLPKAFVDLAKIVARHRDHDRWALLYKLAWRIQNEERNLLRIETDDDVHRALSMRQAVNHDIYKMRAFVRFRLVRADGDRENGAVDQYVAWYRPDHHTLDANERFFVDRFGGMRWAILTPETSMLWDLHELRWGPGVPRSEAPAEDAYEDLWRAYYSSIYNPARLNLDAMRAQLPVRRWVDLPESRTIPELVRISRGRVDSMVRMQGSSASAFIPPHADLPTLRESVHRCRACDLCGRATQPVFGEGSHDARILIVGEQPGDEEDRAGRPFVGPAGQILDQLMVEAGLDRSSVYVTNAVKAFRFEERGKRRIHQSPRSLHIATCRPWLDAEIDVLRPEAIICLGATAAQSVLGRSVRIQEERGLLTRHGSGATVTVTYHPSAILRAPDPSVQNELRRALTEDLRRAVLPMYDSQRQ